MARGQGADRVKPLSEYRFRAGKGESGILPIKESYFYLAN